MKFLTIVLVSGSLLLGSDSFAGKSRFSSEIGVKTGVELLYALSDATQIQINDSQVASLYGRVKSRLPIEGRFQELTDPVLFGIFSLSGQFCQAMIDTDMLRSFNRLVSESILFTEAPEANPEEARRQMLNSHAQIFWGRNLNDNEMKLFLDYLIESANLLPVTSASTRDWLIATCTQFATSLEFLINL